MPKQDIFGGDRRIRLEFEAPMAVLVLTGKQRLRGARNVVLERLRGWRNLRKIEGDVHGEALMARRLGDAPTTKLHAGSLEMDLIEQTVRRDKTVVNLLPTEFKLLEYFLRRIGQIITRSTLVKEVWRGRVGPRTNVIDVHISRLRAKIDKGFEAPLLHTVRGAGYMIRARA